MPLLKPPFLFILLPLITNITKIAANPLLTTHLKVTLLSGPTDATSCPPADLIREGRLITIRYTGTIDEHSQTDVIGRVFTDGEDSTSKFVMGEERDERGQVVIEGWMEGLLDLCRGTTARLVIPPDMGFGEDGGGLVEGGATLDYEIEVLDVTDNKGGGGGGLRGRSSEHDYDDNDDGMDDVKSEDFDDVYYDDDDDDESVSTDEESSSDEASGHEEFDQIDTDGDGRISREELVAYYKTIGYEDMNELDEVIALDDLNKDGYISLKEFFATDDELYEADMMKNVKIKKIEDTNKSELIVKPSIFSTDAQIFDDIDNDNNGSIDKDEFVGYYATKGYVDFESIDNYFQLRDANNDGVLDWNEFKEELNNYQDEEEHDDVISHQLFEQMDTNHDGKIDKDESLAYFHSIGEKDTIADGFWDLEDVNGDGFISYEEFTHNDESEDMILGVEEEDIEDDSVEEAEEDYTYVEDDNRDEIDEEEEGNEESGDNGETEVDGEGKESDNHNKDGKGDGDVKDVEQMKQEENEEDNGHADYQYHEYNENDEYKYYNDIPPSSQDEYKYYYYTYSSSKDQTYEYEYSEKSDGLDVFHEIDVNNDNIITREELNAYYVSKGDHGANVDEILRVEDKDGDGVISYEEYPGPKGPEVADETTD